MKFYAIKLKLVFTLLNLLLSRLNKIMRSILTFLFPIFLTLNPFQDDRDKIPFFLRIFSYPAICLLSNLFFILHTNLLILFAFSFTSFKSYNLLRLSFLSSSHLYATQQVEKMINIAKEWVAKMKEGKLSRTEIWLAVQLTVWRTLIYPLPALNLTKQECEQIMAPILNFVLPALGICRNFPRCIVHA
jgi:hypothetical protein